MPRRVSRTALVEALTSPRFQVVKAASEQRYVLGVGYWAGPRDCIAKGIDGARDYIRPEELEKAAWSFMAKGAPTGVGHATFFGLTGSGADAEVVESYLWPQGAPDWHVIDTHGRETVIKSGDWLIGAILSPRAWADYKTGRWDGFSPQGTGRRLRRSTPGAAR